MGFADNQGYLTAASTGDAVTAGSTASSNIIDFGVTTPQPGVGDQKMTLNIRTVVAAGGSGTVQFALRMSATQSGGALSGTITQVLLTAAMTKGSDNRVDVVGADILTVTIPKQLNQRYADVLAILTSSATITYEARIGEVPSDKNMQLIDSNVGNP